jgi:molybdopterin-guanine dinucleotide biosynthesis protein A
MGKKQMNDAGRSRGRPLRILLTGERGSGKTTCCLNAARLLRGNGLKPGGVACPKLLDETGGVIGIEALNILSDPPSREILARTDRPMDGPRTGMYRFSERGLEFGRKALEEGAGLADVLFADELGPLELRGEGLWNLLPLSRTPSTPPMIIVVRPELVAHARKELESFFLTVIEIRSPNQDKAAFRLLDFLRDRG